MARNARSSATRAILRYVPRVPLPIETPRLVIRSFTLQDAPALHERVFGDDEAMRFIPRGASPSVERTRASIERFVRHEREYGFGLWAVDLNGTAELICDTRPSLVQGVAPQTQVAIHSR